MRPTTEGERKRMATARRVYNTRRAEDAVRAVIVCKYASQEVQALGLDILERLAMMKEESKRG